MGTNKKNINPRQYAALKASINFGRIWISKYPEIEDFFRKGDSYRKINQRLELSTKHSTSERIAMGSIRYALSGYNGEYPDMGESYEGLIENSERKKLAQEHKEANSSLTGKIVGLRMRDEKKGMFKMSDEERSQARKKGGGKTLEMKVGIHDKKVIKKRKEYGKIGGDKTYSEGKGIHDEDYKKNRMRENCIRGGKASGIKQRDEKKGIFGRSPAEVKRDALKATLSRNQLPWSGDEEDYLYKISLDQSYFHPSNTQWKGKPSIKKMQEEINKAFHNGKNIRTKETVRMRLYRVKKKKGKL